MIKEGPERNKIEDQWSIIINLKRRRTEWVSWTKPPERMKKLNTNGSITNNHGYWGVAVRLHDGQVVKATLGASPYTCIYEVELDALKQGLKLIVRYLSLYIKGVYFEGQIEIPGGTPN